MLTKHKMLNSSVGIYGLAKCAYYVQCVYNAPNIVTNMNCINQWI